MWIIDMAEGQREPWVPMVEGWLGNILDEFIVKNAQPTKGRKSYTIKSNASIVFNLNKLKLN